jgi:hypothetical protein
MAIKRSRPMMRLSSKWFRAKKVHRLRTASLLAQPPQRKGAPRSPYSVSRIAQITALGHSFWKGGRPKCSVCNKQLVNYDAKYCKKHAQIGKRNHFYGKKHSEETRAIIKTKLKAIYTDPMKTPNWNGGVTSLHDAIRSLPEEKQWKVNVFTRDNRTCQECGYKGKNIEAHHIVSFANILNKFINHYNQFSVVEDKEVLIRLCWTYKSFWDTDNGKTLCKECHKKTFNKIYQAANVTMVNPAVTA